MFERSPVTTAGRMMKSYRSVIGPFQGVNETPPNYFSINASSVPWIYAMLVSIVSQMVFPTPSATTLRRVRARVVQSTSGNSWRSNAIEISNPYKACASWETDSGEVDEIMRGNSTRRVEHSLPTRSRAKTFPGRCVTSRVEPTSHQLQIIIRENLI
jgi:hypothetical protein